MLPRGLYAVVGSSAIARNYRIVLPIVRRQVRGMTIDFDAIDWNAATRELNSVGYADLGLVLSAESAHGLLALYGQEDRFRSRVVMQRHGFGQGEYQYFAHPLPDVVAGLRTGLYPGLAVIANEWQETLGAEMRYPENHNRMLELCHAEGQTKPTPLMLRYGEGDYNCLHQDLYGDVLFPIQVVILLSNASEFAGGEFVLTEQRPRMQSRAEVVPLRQGHAIAVAVNERPKQGKRGPYRVKQRHGVSTVRSGQRTTLGIIFHDAG